MRTRSRNPFTTVKTAGLLLPIDLLSRIADGDRDLAGLTTESYHLNPGERLNEAVTRAWNACQSAWKTFRQTAATLPASDAGTTLTRDRWLLTLFKELGYGRLQPQKAIEINEKTYPISHGWSGHIPIHLVSFRYELERRTPGASGAATRSPYSLMQELLNRSSGHRWGFLSNGLRLFVLRDNASLSRAANVEFDLETMFDSEVYADFLLLFLVCHQSRVEIPPDGKPEDCWLEKWCKLADDQGTRAREKLRDGVQQAIEALGAGFLTTAGNNELRDRLRSGELATQDYYRQLLRVVYRLLLLLVAEEKRTENGQNLLHPPSTSEAARLRYSRFYSVGRLRTLATQRRGTAHTDLYTSLKVLFEKLRAGYDPLGIPALGSFLFSETSTPDLDAAQLSNQSLLDAIRALCITEDTSGRSATVRRPVDFANLGSDELGSVYESLLELHPRIDADGGPFTLGTASGNERKTTGSYYTPTSLINCLLDSALDPIVSEALDKQDAKQAETALLNLKVCDPACGSGHFLIAAADRLARHLATLRTGDDEPSALLIQHAKRDIIGHCVYGVDINPMSVELCKVALWMEAMEPGKPLSFLDHHIQCGNSLLGTTPALMAKGIPDDALIAIEGDVKTRVASLKKQNKSEKPTESGKRQRLLGEVPFKLGNIAADFARLNTAPDGTLSEVTALQEQYVRLIKSSNYASTRLLADTWCAAFVWKKDDTELGKMCPTERDFREVEFHARAGLLPHVREEVERLRDQYQFFHWYLAFPDVFRLPGKDEMPENEQTGWLGGFDIVLGNPPWERIKLQEQEWFSERRPDIANARNAAERRKKIDLLRATDTALYAEFLDDRRKAEAESHLIRNSSGIDDETGKRSGLFPLCGRGDVNTYSVFAELIRTVICLTGRVGCIVPSGIATDDTTKFFFRDVVESQSLVSLYDIENRKQVFVGVHRSFRFSLLTMASVGHGPLSAAFAFFLGGIEDLQDRSRVFTLGADDLRLLNPNTRTCPIFPTGRDADIAKRAYHRNSVLIREGEQEVDPWGIKFVCMFHMANDSNLFHSRDQLEEDGFTLEGNVFSRGSEVFLPLYEAKMTNPFDHRHGSVVGSEDLSELSGVAAQGTTLVEHQNPNFVVLPRYWVNRQEVDAVVQRIGFRYHFLISFRDVARATDARTAIQAVLPVTAVGHKAPLVLPMKASAQEACAFLAALNSFPYDYFVRQKFGSASLSYFVIKQTPCPPPEAFRQLRIGLPVDWFASRVLELTYTAWDLEPFAQDCGYAGPPFLWDEERRFLLRAELDAAFFHLYGLNRDDTAYVLDTFPIVRRKDMDRHGTYRTKDTILEIYDAMAEAICSGEPYQTRVDPPPADPRVAHPPRGAESP